MGVGEVGGISNYSAEILFQSFSAGGHHEQFSYGQVHALSAVAYPAFPLPTTASSTPQGALTDVLERLLWRVTCPNHTSVRR